jgi:hypothetical protein
MHSNQLGSLTNYIDLHISISKEYQSNTIKDLETSVIIRRILYRNSKRM